MSPTYEAWRAFYRERLRLSKGDRARFETAVVQLVEALSKEPNPSALPPGLRVKRVTGHPGVWEMTFAPDGRATFSYGEPVRDDQPIHIIWRRIGDHSIFDRP